VTTSLTAAYRAALPAETDSLAELMRTADPATPIPACPGWSLANLMTHVGRGHRWAAAMITDRATERIDFRAVADAISEWLGLLETALVGSPVPVLPDGATLHLHATDPGLDAAGEWTVRGAGTGIEWDHGHAKGSVALRGTAVALLLVILRRIPTDDPGLEIYGDTAVFDRWLDTTPF